MSVEKATTSEGRLSDEQVIEKALNAANSHKFKLRFNSEYEDSPLCRHYDTRRQAEVALLANFAFWTQCNRRQMWRLFKQSQLYRPELADYKEYRQNILNEAVDVVDETYDGNFAL